MTNCYSLNWTTIHLTSQAWIQGHQATPDYEKHSLVVTRRRKTQGSHRKKSYSEHFTFHSWPWTPRAVPTVSANSCDWNHYASCFCSKLCYKGKHRLSARRGQPRCCVGSCVWSNHIGVNTALHHPSIRFAIHPNSIQLAFQQVMKSYPHIFLYKFSLVLFWYKIRSLRIQIPNKRHC